MKKSSARLLPFFVVVFAAAGAMRAADIWVGFAGADASEGAVAADAAAGVPSGGGEEAGAASAPAAPQPSDVSRRVLETLAARREQIERREAELEARETLLFAMEERVQSEIERLTALRDEIAAKNEEEAARRNAEIGELVSAYERMRAKDAAAIFNQLDQSVLFSVASRMRPQALSSVLAQMEPARARDLTIQLAGHDEEQAGGGAR